MEGSSGVARGSGGWEGRRWGVCTRTMMGISYIQLYQRHYSGCDVALWAPDMSPLGEIGRVHGISLHYSFQPHVNPRPSQNKKLKKTNRFEEDSKQETHKAQDSAESVAGAPVTYPEEPGASRTLSHPAGPSGVGSRCTARTPVLSISRPCPARHGDSAQARCPQLPRLLQL